MDSPNFFCDLHIHTVASDGGYTAGEVVDLAVGRRMQVIAVTDHDCAASNRKAVEAGEKAGLRVIPGIELTTSERRHVLGYFLQPDDCELYRYLESLRRLSRAHMCGVLERLRPRGITVSEQELAERSGEGIPNMSHLLDLLHRRGDLTAGQFDSQEAVALFGDPDYMVNFFREFAATRPFTDTAGAIRMIRGAGGVPVWAHPFQFGDVEEAELEKLVALGLAGLEVVTPKHDPAQREKLAQLCRNFGLVPTGGTDYHGRYFQSIEKGRQIGTCGVGPEVVEQLEQHRTG
ncbi:MAG: PHP domain-containing protein [Candidatus Glassbacteria bacterium]